MSDAADAPITAPDDVPPHRYTAALAGRLEAKWQERWESEGTFFAPNPAGPLGPGQDAPADLAARPKLFVMDMFPYPSGTGLHVGHPLGYIGTDVYARFKRMTGRNVLHTMGYDAFGLPAEQYAVQTGQHPRVTTEANIANMRRQLRRLGLGHDPRRSVSTTDTRYYRWTQWIFLQIFGAWFDPSADGGAGRARPIDALVAGLDDGSLQPLPGTNPYDRPWAQLGAVERRVVVDNHRLAYVSEAPVNWCPGLGTVLANEEVTADGRSERGNFPVFKRPLRQWMMRITAYAERLIDDLDRLDWPEPVKLMQRNWIGRSEGARVRFPSPAGDIEVFTTRPDTLFGATYMVLAPEHPLVDALLPDAWPAGTKDEWTGGGAATPRAAVEAYRRQAAARTDVDRQAETKDKTGVFTGSFATNPTNGAQIPVFVADYVLMGYGTGAIMAVPAHDQRDFEFAQKFGLAIPVVVQPPVSWFAEHHLTEGTAAERWPECFAGEGVAVNSANDGVSLDGLGMAEAKHTINQWLAASGHGEGTITYKLRDWLFSRQRYWGEPFPIVYDETGLPIAVPEHELPVLLPEVADYSPRTFPEEDLTSAPEPPLARASEWTTVTLDLGDGAKPYRREVNVMPQWAGSCWYYLAYIDPDTEDAVVDPENERYWMGAGSGKAGGVDLYVGGVEHAVLHLLYSRFWHKVLFDLGHVSTTEPFQRLLNQGYVQAYAYTDERGSYVEASEVESRDGAWFHEGRPVRREYGKMGKSLKNSVTPDEMYEQYGADTLRLYEMFGGPFDQSRAWDTTAVGGMYRLLQRIWRNVVDEETGALRVVDGASDEDTQRLLHRTIAAVRDDMEQFKFNTSIARVTELNNHLTKSASRGTPRDVAETLVLLLAPLAPHLAEELWERLGHARSLTFESFPEPDPDLLAESTVEIPVQINGKVRGKVTVAASADGAALEAAARADDKVAALLAGVTVQKVVAVPGRMVSFVVR